MKKLTVVLSLLFFSYLGFYQFIRCESPIFKNDNMWSELTSNKHEKLKAAVAEIEAGITPQWLISTAPILWYHPDEKYPVTDPVELLQDAEIWYREMYTYFPFLNKEHVNLGRMHDDSFKKIRHNDISPLDDVTRLFEIHGTKNGFAGFELKYDREKKMNSESPLLWRIGRDSMFKFIQSESPDEIFLPVELWFHYNYSTTGIYVGNHDGDWESTLVIYKLRIVNDELVSQAFVIVPTYHGHSKWFCHKNLSYKDGRFELFSSLGTHATYATDGDHPNFLVYPDRTARGTAWDTSKNIRALEKEYYYGYSGSWGMSTYIHFQSAGIAPGPHFKYLPGGLDQQKSVRAFKQVAESCK